MKLYSKSLCLLILFVLCSIDASAENVFRIDVGSRERSYSNEELQHRVWDLERAVWQLQQRVFSLEASKPAAAPQADSVICTIEAMGDSFSGTGTTKAVATSKAIDACKAANNNSGFFCKSPKCSP